MKKGMEYRLQLGEIINLKANFFEKTLRMSYTGEYATGRYSIALISTTGNNSYAYNLYFVANQKEIVLPYGTLAIIEVDEQSLYFMYRPKA